MIGKIYFGAGRGELTLADDGSVEATGPQLRDDFLLLWKSHWPHYSPADGPWGVAPLEAFARLWGGHAVIEPKRHARAAGGGEVVY